MRMMMRMRTLLEKEKKNLRWVSFVTLQIIWFSLCESSMNRNFPPVMFHLTLNAVDILAQSRQLLADEFKFVFCLVLYCS